MIISRCNPTKACFCLRGSLVLNLHMMQSKEPGIPINTDRIERVISRDFSHGGITPSSAASIETYSSSVTYITLTAKGYVCWY